MGRDKKTISPLEAYVAEWATEDVDRYERLSGRSVEREERVVYATTTRAQRLKDGPPRSAIITVVLEVPRPAVEQVLTILRGATRSSASYLPACAGAAADAAKYQDEAVAMRAQIQRLERGLMQVATARERELYAVVGGEPYVAETHSELAAVIISEARTSGLQVAQSIRAALNEKKTDVAAKLLAALPEDPFE